MHVFPYGHANTNEDDAINDEDTFSVRGVVLIVAKTNTTNATHPKPASNPHASALRWLRRYRTVGLTAPSR